MQAEAADTCCYRAVLALHAGALGRAQACIDEARRALYEEIAALVAESYSRAYSKVVQLQVIALDCT